MTKHKGKRTEKRDDKRDDKHGVDAKAEQQTERRAEKKAEAGDITHGGYTAQLEPLQIQLNVAMRALQQKGDRVVILFEGRDTAGKGGAIFAVSEKLNPRQVQVAALGVPGEREKSQWYFQRYVPHLPAAGEMVLFDRSWYNRAGVEAVMGFATPGQVKAFLKQAPEFERLLVDDGIRLFKYWLTVDQAEQEERFAERLSDPLKRWKLSPVDLKARQHYDDYGRARDRMLKATHTSWAPWTLVDFNDQKTGRLTLIRDLLSRLPQDARAEPDVEMPPLPAPPQREKFRGPVKPI
jgi:polyphosphate kinase 2